MVRSVRTIPTDCEEAPVSADSASQKALHTLRGDPDILPLCSSSLYRAMRLRFGVVDLISFQRCIIISLKEPT
jgi:hypothetical protein